MNRLLSYTVSAVILGGAVLTHELGCKQESCLVTADEACVIASPCTAVSFECSAGQVGVRRIAKDDPDLPGGLDALGAEGDVLLENDRVRVVIDAIDHPHFIAPTGGMIIDLATRAGNVDGLESIYTATGLLPGDAAHYVSLEIIDGDGFAAVQVRGHLDGHEDILVNTRYELRPCDPGVRIRTEVVNLEPDDAIVTVTDGWFWGGRSELAFTPTAGRGFVHPPVSLTSIEDVFEEVPFMAAAGHGVDPTAVGIVRCDQPLLDGFQSDQISATGTRRRILPPTDYEIYERFITITDGPSVAPAIDVLLDIRRRLFGEAWVTLEGHVDIAGDRLNQEAETRASVLVYEGFPELAEAERIPWTQIVPDERGNFSVRVPRNKQYGYTVSAFGRSVFDRSIGVVLEKTTLPGVELPAAARVELIVASDGAPTTAQVFFHPADDDTKNRVTARLHGAFTTCAPLLGPPHGGSPACNRVIVREPVTLHVPPGRYDVYATRGPFSSIDRHEVELRADVDQTLVFELRTIDGLRPDGALSADFHVHGGKSFDSSIPDRDRVLAFLAADIDVLAATDHDGVGSYDQTIQTLGVGDRLRVMNGLETTGHILFDYVPDTSVPRVVGHWNFWPLVYDSNGPYNGAPWDELVEPGALFDRVDAIGLPVHGVIQLNHPWGALEFGRDTGFPRAVEVETNVPPLTARSKDGPSLLLTRPPGATRSNRDYDAQEVMNGTNNLDYVAHRAFWFYLLDHGVVRAGTANSDSHGLTDNVIGTPRNIVFAGGDLTDFDEVRFNTAVKAGRMFGTNGPMLEVVTQNTLGATVTPSRSVFEPSPDATLVVRVRSAPWVPVDQVRVIVNGTVARIFAAELPPISDVFSSSVSLRYDLEVPLAELLPEGDDDVWIVIEAGAPLVQNADLDCDGVPDTGDNNRDGTIDWRDVDRNDDDVVDRQDEDVDEDGDVDDDDPPDRCDDDVGPLAEPDFGRDRLDRAYHFRAVTPGGYPLAFTNPLLIDRDGDGKFRGGEPER